MTVFKSPGLKLLWLKISTASFAQCNACMYHHTPDILEGRDGICKLGEREDDLVGRQQPFIAEPFTIYSLNSTWEHAHIERNVSV